jgi:hypothetical protein
VDVDVDVASFVASSNLARGSTRGCTLCRSLGSSGTPPVAVSTWINSVRWGGGFAPALRRTSKCAPSSAADARPREGTHQERHSRGTHESRANAARADAMERARSEVGYRVGQAPISLSVFVGRCERKISVAPFWGARGGGSGFGVETPRVWHRDVLLLLLFLGGQDTKSDASFSASCPTGRSSKSEEAAQKVSNFGHRVPCILI